MCTALYSANRLKAEALLVTAFWSKWLFFINYTIWILLNRIIEEMVTINTYGMTGQLDINNMTKKIPITKK